MEFGDITENPGMSDAQCYLEGQKKLRKRKEDF